MPFESTDFTETCQAEGFPPPVSNWSRLLQKFPLARTELGDGNLTITNLSTTDSGLYECVGCKKDQDEPGGATRRLVLITVQSPANLKQSALHKHPNLHLR